jgi:predicted HicB family RNase H-like nuclease
MDPIGSSVFDLSEEALRQARVLYSQRPLWTDFFRDVFAGGGLHERLFPQPDQFRQYQGTAHYREVVAMLRDLRTTRKMTASSRKSDSPVVITVRLPPVLHDSLKAAAHKAKQSMNRLCVAALIDAVTAPGAETEHAS